MKIKFAQIFALAGLVVAFSSCKEENPCDSVWISEFENPSFIAEIDSVNQTMSLQIGSMSTTTSGFQGEVYQSYFVGDFNVVASFNNFVAGPVMGTDGNPYAELIMYNSETPDTVLDTAFVRAGISRDYIYGMIGLQKDKKPRLATTTSGTLRIQKIGGSLLAQVSAGAETATVSKAFTFNPLRFAVRLGCFNDSTVSNTTGIKITSFSVSGTSEATLVSDQFKCNSIIY